MTEPLAAALANLEAVALDVLIESADLQTRRDRKYLVPTSMLGSLLDGTGLKALDIDGKRSFRYESVYFDTPALVSYKAAAHRRRLRFKVRTRSYLDSGVSWLEVKTRDRRGLNNKERLAYDIKQRATLAAPGLHFLRRYEQIAPSSSELHAAITTRYHRATLLDEGSGSRTTIDTNVEWETPAGSRTELPGMAIVETKTDGAPCEIDHRLWSMHIRPKKMSKYCAGLAALTPGLPANKWNRVLRRHFNWEPTRRDLGLASVLSITHRDRDGQQAAIARDTANLLHQHRAKESYS
jgi:hypothetical protein